MLDAHDAGVGQQALWVVVDELTVDEAVDAVRLDALHLCLHLFALGALQLGQLARALDAHARTEHLDLVRVHRRVGNQNARILQALRAVGADALVQDEALVQVAVVQLAADLFDDLHVLEVG